MPPSAPLELSIASTGFEAMDSMHRNLVNRLNSLSLAGSREFPAGYDQLVIAFESTFGVEEQWMDDTDFPGLHCHREQHARVLGALHKMQSKVNGHDLEAARLAIQELLPQWFALHAATMDTVLALYMLQSEANRQASTP